MPRTTIFSLRRFGLLALSAAFALALAACGGDGGHSSDHSTPPSNPPDNPPITQAPIAAEALKVDTSYGTQGQVDFPPAARITVAKMQPNGKLLLAGHLSNGPSAYYGAPGQAAVWRLNADGSPDSSFGVDGVALLQLRQRDTVRNLALAPDQHIVLMIEASTTCTFTGFYCEPHGPLDWALARLDPQGALDTRFGEAGLIAGLTDLPEPMVVQPDGRIIVHRYGSRSLVRYTAEGVLDASFHQGQPLPTYCEAQFLNQLPDGRIIASSLRAAAIDPTASDGRCVQIWTPEGLSAGQSDWVLSSGKPRYFNFVTAKVNRRGGFSLSYSELDIRSPQDVDCFFSVEQYTAAGQLEERFGQQGRARLRAANAPSSCTLAHTLHSDDGSVMLIGAFYPEDGNTLWARLTPTGQPDTTFSPTGLYVAPGELPWRVLHAPTGHWLVIDNWMETRTGPGPTDRMRITRYRGESH